MRVTKEGLPPVERTIAVTEAPPPVAIKLPRGAELQVAFSEGARGADKVVLLETGDAGGHRTSAITDPEGVARFAALPPGNYRVTAIVQNVPPATVALALGETKKLVLDNKEKP